MHFDPRYIEVTDEIHAVIMQAYHMHKDCYHALARMLNFESGTTAKDLVTRKAKYINKEKLRLLEEYITHSTPNTHFTPSTPNTHNEETDRAQFNFYPSDVVRFRKIIIDRHGVITGNTAKMFRELLDNYEQRDFKKLGL